MLPSRPIRCSLVVVLLVTLALSRPARAQSPLLIADLEGLPIPATTASLYFCHDFEHPLIRCFRTGEALEEAVALHTPAAARSEGTLTAAAVSYVKIYEWSAFAGNFAYLSQNYSRLGDIGWDNKISSYAAVNSETGGFYTNAGYGGSIDYFCCNQTVASLSSTFDNQISSANRT